MKALYRHQRASKPSVPRASAVKLWAKIHGQGVRIHAHVSVGAALRVALPELRTYDEAGITRRIGRVCHDISLVRRRLIEDGLMTREEGMYRFTRLGEAAWRVEHFIGEKYLAQHS
jgi:hypothetical protein